MGRSTLLVLLALTAIFSGCISEKENLEVDNTSIESTQATVETSIATSTTIATTTTKETSTTTKATTTSTTLKGLCNSDNDCPNATNSSRYCWREGDYWNGDLSKIYMDSINYICSDGRCAEIRSRMPLDRCVASMCFKGDCYKTHCFNERLDESEEFIDCGGIDCPSCSLTKNITCYSDCDCMSRESQMAVGYYSQCKVKAISASELATQGRCHDFTVYQNLITHKCKKPGTPDSYCTSKVSTEMVTASCRDSNCTIDCDFKRTAYPNLAEMNDLYINYSSID